MAGHNASPLTLSAEQPGITTHFAQRMEPAGKRIKTTSSAQSVAFITCAEKAMDFATNDDDRRALLQAVHNVLQAGATIVNIAFSRVVPKDLVDPGTILPALKLAFDATWLSSAGQPAYSFRSVGSVMSFFSASCGTLLSERVLDPEDSLPALMLTFNGPEGLLCTVTTSVPKLPTRTRARMLRSFADAATDTKTESIFVGRPWQNINIFIETQVAQLKLPFQLSSNELMCLFPHIPDYKPLKCFSPDTDGPDSFIVTSDSSGSVEQPAPRVRNFESCSVEQPIPV